MFLKVNNLFFRWLCIKMNYNLSVSPLNPNLLSGYYGKMIWHVEIGKGELISRLFGGSEGSICPNYA